MRDDPAIAADPAMAAARAAARTDPELAGFVAREQAFDRALAAKLREIPVPPELAFHIARSIATARPASTPRPWATIAALALAACLGAVVALNVFQSARQSPPITSEGTIAAAALFNIADLLHDRAAAPAVHSQDYVQLTGYIAEQGAPMPRQPPKAFCRQSGVACSVVRINGTAVGMICFKVDGDTYHLYTLDRARHPPVPEQRQPLIRRHGEGCEAVWTTDEQIHVVTTKADEQALRRVLEI